MSTEYGRGTGFDRVRQQEIGRKKFELDYFEEAFSSEHMLVRLYRVLADENRF
jgi:dolichyl-diphosphooligosaccharide--protein glycosyltransferase